MYARVRPVSPLCPKSLPSRNTWEILCIFLSENMKTVDECGNSRSRDVAQWLWPWVALSLILNNRRREGAGKRRRGEKEIGWNLIHTAMQSNQKVVEDTINTRMMETRATAAVFSSGQSTVKIRVHRHSASLAAFHSGECITGTNNSSRLDYTTRRLHDWTLTYPSLDSTLAKARFSANLLHHQVTRARHSLRHILSVRQYSNKRWYTVSDCVRLSIWMCF